MCAAGAGYEEMAKAKKEVAVNGVASALEPEWMILTWPRPMHFEHTAVDDHPGLSGSRTKLSVSLTCSLPCVSEHTSLCFPFLLGFCAPYVSVLLRKWYYHLPTNSGKGAGIGCRIVAQCSTEAPDGS